MGPLPAQPCWCLHTTSWSPYLTCSWWNQGAPTLWGFSVWHENSGERHWRGWPLSCQGAMACCFDILILLFCLSLHKAEKEKERGRQGRTGGDKEDGREATERWNFTEGQFKIACGKRWLPNRETMVDVYGFHLYKTGAVQDQGHCPAENLCTRASPPGKCPGNLDESEDRTWLDHLLAPRHPSCSGTRCSLTFLN